jgi:hypothetical protein
LFELKTDRFHISEVPVVRGLRINVSTIIHAGYVIISLAVSTFVMPEPNLKNSRNQLQHSQNTRNNWGNQPEPVPARPLPRDILTLHQFLVTRPFRECLKLVVQRLHVLRGVDDGRQMHGCCDREESPVAPRKHALFVRGVACVRIAQEAERRDWAEELVADCPAQRPLLTKKARSVLMVRRARWWEVDEKRRDSHE